LKEKKPYVEVNGDHQKIKTDEFKTLPIFYYFGKNYNSIVHSVLKLFYIKAQKLTQALAVHIGER